MKKFLCHVCAHPISFIYLPITPTDQYCQCSQCSLIQLVSRSKNGAKPSYTAFDASACLHNSSSMYRILNFFKIGNTLNNFYVQGVYEKRKRLIERYKKQGRILDIGCANGTLLAHFGDSWTRMGIDPNTIQIREGKKLNPDISLFAKTLEKFSSKEKFDVVMLWHVFEHLEDPPTQLKRIKKLLKKGGLLVVEVPSATSLWLRVFRRDWQLLMYPQHLYFYTKPAFAILLNKTGFKVLGMSHEGIASSAAGSVYNFLIRRNIPSFMAVGCSIVLFFAAAIGNFFYKATRENVQVVALLK